MTLNEKLTKKLIDFHANIKSWEVLKGNNKIFLYLNEFL